MNRAEEVRWLKQLRTTVESPSVRAAHVALMTPEVTPEQIAAHARAAKAGNESGLLTDRARAKLSGISAPTLKRARKLHREDPARLTALAHGDATRKVTRKGGVLYVVGHRGWPDYVKVGITTGTLSNRMAAINNASPEGIECHATWPVANKLKATEARVHAALSSHRTNGEWFHLPAHRAIAIIQTVLA